MSTPNMPMNLEEVLNGIVFPTAKVEIIVYADQQGASEKALELLRGLPARSYKNMQEINRYLGLVDQQPGNENLWPSNRKQAKG